MTPAGATHSTATFNVGDASSAKVIADLTRLTSLPGMRIMGLQEVGDRGAELAKVCDATGWRLIRNGSQPASAHIALLLHPDVRVDGTRLQQISGRNYYVGHEVAGCKTSGRPAAKYVLSADVTINGQKSTVGVTHLTPSAERAVNATTPELPGSLVGSNIVAIAGRDLVAMQVRACAAWMRAQMRPAYLVGDFNLNYNGTLGRRLLRPLVDAATAHTKPSHGTRAIDIVWTRPHVDGDVDALGGYSSDHRPVVFTPKES